MRLALVLFVLTAVSTPSFAEDVEDWPVGTKSTLWWPKYLTGSYRNWGEIFPVRPVPRDDGAVSALPNGALLAPDFGYRAEGESQTPEDYMAANRVTGLIAVKDGDVRLELYGRGGRGRRAFRLAVARQVGSLDPGRARTPRRPNRKRDRSDQPLRAGARRERLCRRADRGRAADVLGRPVHRGVQRSQLRCLAHVDRGGRTPHDADQ